MADKISRFALIYAGFASLLNSYVYMLGEKRPDAYLALNILVYYISYAVIGPYSKTPLTIKILNILMLIVFTTIVAYRIMEVLAP